MSRSAQLSLPITEFKQRLEYFFVGENQLLCDTAERIALADEQAQLTIWGGAGVGKTYLLCALCQLADTHAQCASYLPMATLCAHSPQTALPSERVNFLAIDDIDCVAGLIDWQSALINLIDMLRERRARIVISANKKPDTLDILPDLASRLMWGAVMPLLAPDDDAIEQALRQRAADMQLPLSDQVVQYLLNHHPRSLASLFAILQVIDQASLNNHRRPTVAFIKSVLADSSLLLPQT